VALFGLLGGCSVCCGVIRFAMVFCSLLR
jgi:hypothetical protein